MRSVLSDLSQQLVGILGVVHLVQAVDCAANSRLVVVHLHFRSQLENECRKVARSDAILELAEVVRVQAVELLQVGLLAEQLHAIIVERLHPGLTGVIADAERQDEAVVEHGGLLTTLSAAVQAILQIQQFLVALLASFVEGRSSCRVESWQKEPSG